MVISILTVFLFVIVMADMGRSEKKLSFLSLTEKKPQLLKKTHPRRLIELFPK